MTALAPCPICQGPAELWRHNEEPPRKSWCACMGRCAVLISSEYKTDEEAIAAWNTRARTPLEAELLVVLQKCLTTLERVDTSEGVCCCGDDMERHPEPMNCGHTPTDMGDYHASLAMKEARTLIAKATP